MHRGEDTAYYLALGYRVIALEANPHLVQACQKRFAQAIDSGALTIVEGAIAAATDGTVDFYLDANSQWGSIDPGWVRKKQIDRSQQAISVPAIDLAACMRRYGVPHYLKIDIEGADRLCLEALRDAPGLPRFISMEAELFDFDALLAELDLLEQLGYTRFAVVGQGRHSGREMRASSLSGESLSYSFTGGSSGPFGEDLGNLWRSRRSAIRRHRAAFRRRKWLMRSGRALGRHPIWKRNPKLWRRFAGYYDTHAER